MASNQLLAPELRDIIIDQSNRQYQRSIQDNPTLLVPKQITRHFSQPSPEKIARIRHRVQLCGLTNSGYIAMCGCGFKFSEFRCGYVHLCPTCAKIKSRKLARSLRENVQFLNQQINGFRQKKLRFLTLTIKTSEDPEKQRKLLIKYLNRFLKRKYAKDRIDGCVASIHIEKSKNIVGEYHVHFHTILYSKWLDVRNHTVSTEWSKATYENGKYVYIEQIKGLNEAVNYISQYLTKSSSFSFDDKIKLFFNKRFFFTYGIFNKGNPKYCMVLLEKKLCLACGENLQFIGSHTEEYAILKRAYETKPPPFPKIATKFLFKCSECDGEFYIEDIVNAKLCKWCYEKTTPEYKIKQLSKKIFPENEKSKI